jgi:uncharacterized protein (TIGR03085 family)
MTSLARRERMALCDTALRAGPDAPTLCEPWDVKDLVCHLLVRERRPIAATGIAVGPLSGLPDRAMARLARTEFPVLVERFRSPWVLPFAVPGVEQVLNTTEFLVHHEDIRRAQPDWSPRLLSDADEATLWSFLKVVGRGLTRFAGVPVRIEWEDHGADLRGGDGDPVVVSGVPSELALMLYGRERVAQVTYDGPDAAIGLLRGTNLGI